MGYSGNRRSAFITMSDTLVQCIRACAAMAKSGLLSSHVFFAFMASSLRPSNGSDVTDMEISAQCPSNSPAVLGVDCRITQSWSAMWRAAVKAQSQQKHGVPGRANVCKLWSLCENASATARRRTNSYSRQLGAGTAAHTEI
jgi:hypothetical protein